MIRKTRNLLISLILLTVIIGTMILVRLTGKPDEVPGIETVRAAEILSDFTVADLRSVKSETPDGSLHFYSSDGENWMLADTPEFYRLERNRVIFAIRTLSRLQSGNIIAEDAGDSDLVEYGLDYPAATLTFRDRDGKSTIVEIGMPSPSGAGRYGRAAGSGTIVLIPSFAAEYAFNKPGDFRDMSLPAVSIEKLTYLEFRYDGTTFHMEPRVEDNPYLTIVSPFIITSPWRGRYGLDDSAFQTITTEEAPFPVGVQEFLDDRDPEDPSLGLAEDSADMLYLEDFDGNLLYLIIGNEDSKGNYYIRFGDREDAVFTLSESDLAFIRTDPFRLISKFVFLASIFQVSQVKVEKGYDIWIMSRTERGDPEDTKDDRFEVNNLEVARKEFTSVYQKFISIMREGVVVDDVSLESPEVRITVSSTRPGIPPMIIRYWPYNDVYYQVSLGDSPLEFLVGRYQVDDFIEDLAALSEYGS